MFTRAPTKGTYKNMNTGHYIWRDRPFYLESTNVKLTCIIFSHLLNFIQYAMAEAIRSHLTFELLGVPFHDIQDIAPDVLKNWPPVGKWYFSRGWAESASNVSKHNASARLASMAMSCHQDPATGIWSFGPYIELLRIIFADLLPKETSINFEIKSRREIERPRNARRVFKGCLKWSEGKKYFEGAILLLLKKKDKGHFLCGIIPLSGYFKGLVRIKKFLKRPRISCNVFGKGRFTVSFSSLLIFELDKEMWL